MKKITFFVLVILVFVVSAFSYFEKTKNKDISTDDFNITIDKSVGCPNIPILDKDMNLKIENNIFIVKSNYKNIQGLYMNAILSKKRNFVDNSKYILSGEFLVPKNAKNEQLDINLQNVENYTEYHAEILWDLNPDNLLYEWIWTRGQDLNKPIKLFKVKNDFSWHKFTSIVRYTSNPKKRIFESVAVDNNYKLLNLSMGTLSKEWENSFMTLFETTNRYTGCIILNNFMGEAHWKNIYFVRKDIP